MSEQKRWERLIELMEQERTLLIEFSDASKAMRDGLHRRDWPALESALKHLDLLADRLEGLEKSRNAEAGVLLEGVDNLETTIAGLPEDLRRRFRDVRGELKARLVTVRSRMRGISGYAAARGRLGRELMEELIPSTRGRVYNNRGRTSTAGGVPLVVSRHL